MYLITVLKGKAITVDVVSCICKFVEFKNCFIGNRKEVFYMPIVQVALDVPDDLYKDVLNGSLELLGMVKDGQKKVIKHIPKAKLAKSNKNVKVQKKEIWQALREHKAVVIGTGAAVAIAGVGAYAIQNRKERKKQIAEEKIAGFKKALKDYLRASKKEKLNAKVVDDLLETLDELEKKKLGKDVELTISASQLTELIYSIFTYTESLAKANEFEVKISKPKSGMQGSITSLKSYLEIQKQILEKVA